MKYPVLLLPLASDDLLESIAWYDEQKAGLGDEFYAAVVALVDLIGTNPLLFPAQSKTVRSASLKRFPFFVFYKFEQSKEQVIILAVLHQSRNPKIWKGRG